METCQKIPPNPSTPRVLCACAVDVILHTIFRDNMMYGLDGTLHTDFNIIDRLKYLERYYLMIVSFTEYRVFPRKATRLFENSKKTNPWTSLVLPLLNCYRFNFTFGILQPKIGCKFKKLWLLKVSVCEKVKSRRPSSK